MTTPPARRIRIVAPFRPFVAETGHHQLLSDFDWIDAIRMMKASAERACGCEVHVLTDVDTDLPFPCFKYATTTRRLMLWYLEIAACYLESADCDCDTIALDSDQLIYQDLARWFTRYADLGILVRKPPKSVGGYPILNGVQWWSHKAKVPLAAFYRRALALAMTLPEEELIWGADTIALWKLLAPLAYGMFERDGLRVRMIDANEVIEPLSYEQQCQIDSGKKMRRPYRAVLDFRNTRKLYMRRVFDQTLAEVCA